MMPLASANAWRISVSLGYLRSVTPHSCNADGCAPATDGSEQSRCTPGIGELGGGRRILRCDEQELHRPRRAQLRYCTSGERKRRSKSGGADIRMRRRAVVVGVIVSVVIGVAAALGLGDRIERGRGGDR